MKRTIISAAVIALVAGGAGVSMAEPGPNGKNDFGLCKAYFAGSETGKENKRKAGPFAALEAAASDGDDSTPIEDDVRSYCSSVFPGGKTEAPGGSGSGADSKGKGQA